jgi:hypothetical protein
MNRSGVSALLADVLVRLDPQRVWPLPCVDAALIKVTYASLVPITALPLSVRAFDTGSRTNGIY